MRKRIINFLLFCCLAFLLIPAMSTTADAATMKSGYWEYEVNSGLATVTAYTGSASTVTIPSSFDNYQVTAIGNRAFAGNATMTSVNFPSSLTSIGEYAFEGCVGLTSITLPEKLADLRARAFQNCTRLNKITFKCTSLNDIGLSYSAYGQPFYNAGTASSGISVVFADGCTRIPNNLFYAHSGAAYAPNITTVTIADTVISVGDYAFVNCVNLKTVDFGEGVQAIYQYAFDACTKLTTVDLPDSTLQSIHKQAFRNCANLKNVTLPGSLTSIGEYAFEGCVSFTSITLPEKLADLSARAFQNCTKVENITIKCKSLNDISNSYNAYGQPFYGVGSATDGVAVTFTSTCTRIPSRLFYAHSGAAYAPNIVSVTMADSVISVGEYAFANCDNLKTVNLGKGVQNIYQYAFDACTNLTTASLSNSALQSIHKQAFRNCTNLKNVSLPSSLTSIGEFAFEGCVGFTSITLPENLASLGPRVFQNCTKVTKITVKSHSLGDLSLNYSTYAQPFYNVGIAAGGIDVIFADGCTKIPNNLFYAYGGDNYAANLSTVQIADTVKHIGNNAFRGCVELSTVHFGGDAPTFGSDVFAGVTATANYPTAGNWPVNSLQNYGGTIKWVGVTPIKITKQPTTAYANSGAVAKTTVSATGDGLKYQWYIRNASGTTYSKSSITSATYSCTMTTTSHDRRAYCVITDKYGKSVQSQTVVLRMSATITSQPTNASAASGSKVTTTVKATGSGLKYQWYVCNPGSTTYSKSSITSATYSCNMTSSISGRKVYCVVTDSYGKTAKSNTVTLSMKASGVTITKQPTTAYAKSGAVAKTTVSATGEGLKYQWYIRNASGTTYSKSSITSATYSCTMTTTSHDRRAYCVITDKYGKSVQSQTVVLRMSATITNQPTNASAASGSKVTTTVKATGSGLKYQWYVCNPGSTTYGKSSITSATYSCNMTSSISGRKVYCVVTDSYGKTAKSNTVTLTLKSTLKITTQPVSKLVANGATATVKVAATGSGLKYQWYVCNANSSTFSKSSVTTASYSVAMSAERDGRQLYCVVTDAYGNSVKSDTVALIMLK